MEGYKICEVNSGPDFKGFEKATGLNVAQLIYQYIQDRLSGFHGATIMLDKIQTLDAA